MKAVLSLPARMAGTRLPGKVLAPIMGRPMMAYQIERLRKSQAEVVVATTTDPADQPIADLATQMGIRCVRGSATDLIARHAQVMRETDADALVLSGADDPFLEASLVDDVLEMLASWVDDGGSRRPYVESTGYPFGMNCWAWTRLGMDEADAESVAALDKLIADTIRSSGSCVPEIISMDIIKALGLTPATGRKGRT